MNTRLSIVALALSSLVAGHAMAADASVGKTRDEVRAELAQAIRSGDMIADGATGQRYNEVSPAQYAAVRAEAVVADAAPVVGKTRAQVKAELAEAIRTGDMIADGATGAKYNELFPTSYAQSALAQGNSRDVRAEAVESSRNNGG